MQVVSCEWSHLDAATPQVPPLQGGGAEVHSCCMLLAVRAVLQQGVC